MNFTNISLNKKILVMIIMVLFFQFISATVFRYTTIPVWLTLLQGSFLYVVFLLILFWIIKNSSILNNHTGSQLLILLLYIIRGLIAIANEYYPVLPNLNDVSYYHHIGTGFSRDLVIQGSGIGAAAFGNYLIGPIYLFLGASPLFIALFNSFLFSLTVIVLVKIGNELNVKHSWVIPLLVFIIPSSYLYIPVLLRESIFLLCAVLFFNSLITVFKRKSSKIYSHIILILLLLLCTLIRPQVFPIFFAIYIFFRIYYFRSLAGFIPLLIVLGIGLILSVTYMPLFQYINSDLLNLYYFQNYRNAFSDLPSAYLVNIKYYNWVDFFSYLPIFVGYFLFSPFPWIHSNYNYFMATADSLVSLLIIPCAVIAVIRRKNIWNVDIIPAIAAFFIYVIPFSIIEAYPMGAVRHRMIIILLALPVIASLFSDQNKNKSILNSDGKLLTTTNHKKI